MENSPALPTLLEHIARAFPDFEVVSPVLVDKGWDHIVVVVNGAYVFRLPRTEVYRRRLKTEVALLELLAAHTAVPLPRYDRLSPDGSCGGYPLLPGQTLSRDRFDALTGQEREDLARQLADLLTVLHTLPTQEVAALGLASHDGIAEWQADLARDKAVILSCFEPRQHAVLEQFLRDFFALLPPPQTCAIHGDFYREHILINEGTKQGPLAGILDFGDATLGDPAYDFAELWEFGFLFVQQVYTHYNGPRDEKFTARSRYYFYAIYLRNLASFVERGDEALLEVPLKRLRLILKAEELKGKQ